LDGVSRLEETVSLQGRKGWGKVIVPGDVGKEALQKAREFDGIIDLLAVGCRNTR